MTGDPGPPKEGPSRRKRGRPPHPDILAWWQRAIARLASAVRRVPPGTLAMAGLATCTLAALATVAVVVWVAEDGDEPGAVVQPSATARATGTIAAPATITPPQTAPTAPIDPGRVFGNLPAPIVEETIQVSPFDSPLLTGGIYHLSLGGTDLVRIASEVRVAPPYDRFSQSSLSADGRWLAFAPDVSPQSAVPQVVYVKDLVGREPARPVANFGRVMDLTISPDGQKLILAGAIELGLAVVPGQDF